MKTHEECIEWPELEMHLQTLQLAAQADDPEGIKTVLKACVHGYGDPSQLP